MNSKLNIYSDGGARGNPGPSAIAFIVLNKNGKILEKHSRYVGIRTNNQAEYEALISALEFATEQNAEEVICHIDSELVVKQLNEEYQVKDRKLRTLWLKVQGLKQNFKKISFISVPRTDIHVREVDRLLNQTLNHISRLRVGLFSSVKNIFCLRF